MAGTGCPKVQVGPNKWITPMCGVPTQLDVRSFAAGAPTRRGFRAHGFAGAAGPALPPQIDLRRFDGPVRDQGQVGVCWAHALSGVIDNGARQSGRPHAAVSALHAVAKDSWHDVHAKKPSRPLTLEQHWPYEPPKACAFNDDNREVWCQREYGVAPNSWRSNPQLVAELSRADSLHALRFDKVEKLSSRPGNAEEVAGVLASGRAIWADLAFDRNAWSYRQLKDGVFDDYASSRPYGHAVVIVGYRSTAQGRQFLLKNSWGTDWAHGGYAWMPAAVLAKHLRRAFVLRVMSSQGAPVDPVTPPATGPSPQPFPFPFPVALPTTLTIPGLHMSQGAIQVPGLGTVPLPVTLDPNDTAPMPAGACELARGLPIPLCATP